MKKIAKIISTFFYIGYFPLIPGTAASLLAVALYLVFKNNSFIYALLFFVITALGYIYAGQAEKNFKRKDPAQIVIDEVAGMLLALWGMSLDWILLIAGFFIFRALDVVKPYPANKIEKINGAAGIMGDDLVAGAYTNIVLQIVTRIIY